MNDVISIINGLINGELKSPQVYEESFYINLRITGTGITERYKEDKNGEIIYQNDEPIKYSIDRLEKVFLSDRFLKACQGIPVLIEHPKTNLLNGENYKDHVVGCIVQAFIKEDIKEVWGVARIYDPKVLLLIQNGLKSTSPAIKSKNIPNNDNNVVEELFYYIDHLALVVDGYWDNYSLVNEAIQIDSNTIKIMPNNTNKEDKMAEEKDIKTDEENKTYTDSETDNNTNEIVEKLTIMTEAINSLTSQLASQTKTDNDTDTKSDNDSVDIAAMLDKAIEDINKLSSLIANKDQNLDNNEELNNENMLNDDASDDANEEEIVNLDDEEELQELADKAYNLSLKHKEDGVKYIKARDRDTKESYIERFLKHNASLLAEKYKSLVNTKADKNNYALCVDAFHSIEKVIAKKNEIENKYNSNKVQIIRKDERTTEYKNVF